MKKNNLISLLNAGLILISLGIWSLLIWEHYHGGVPKHHLFARADMPEISNWWGGISIPVLTYFLLDRIRKRTHSENDSIDIQDLKPIFFALIMSLGYSILLASFFASGNTELSGLMFKALFFIPLFIPIYKAEYYLGFVIGLTYTFGGVLPILIGLFVVLTSYIVYKILRPLCLKIGQIIFS